MELNYATGDGDAGDIIQAILAKSDREFQPSKETITAFEALVGPVVVGVLAGLFWAGINQSAEQLASGEYPEAHGRRAGLQRILIWIAELLVPVGATALGLGLLVLIAGWAASRPIKRPERTVWLAQPA